MSAGAHGAFVDPEDGSWGHRTVRDADGHRVHLTRGGRTDRGAPSVVCLHGWPGGWFDYRLLRPLLEPVADVVLPDLRGFGGSERPDLPVEGYSRSAQARVVLSVLDALGIERAVLVGYDIGSSIAVQIAREAPERVIGLALGNPMNPAAGPLLLAPHHRGEFWYQDFHQLELATALVDGEPRAVAAYLEHFYRHWGGRQEPLGPAHLAALVRAYAEPGAFTASLKWYRSGSSSLPVALAAADGTAAPDRAGAGAVGGRVGRGRPAVPARVQRGPGGPAARAQPHRARRRRALRAAGGPGRAGRGRCAGAAAGRLSRALVRESGPAPIAARCPLGRTRAYGLALPAEGDLQRSAG